MESRNKKRWVDAIGEPCDPAVFYEALQAWQAGADVPLPKPGPGPGYVLTDVAVNRCGMHATKFLRERGIEDPQRYLWRIMHMFELIEAAPGYGLGKHVRDDALSGALVHAAATARILPPTDPLSQTMVFDMDDVVAKVAAFLEEGQEP